MNQRAKNVAVGLTVMVAMALLAGMILLFAGMPGFLARGYYVRLDVPSTGGASKGDRVHMAGMPVGKITEVDFRQNDPSKGVEVTILIDNDVNLPAHIKGQITQQMIGGSYTELVPLQPPKLDAKGNPVFLPHKNAPPIQGSVRGNDIISELRPAMDSLSTISQSLASLIGKPESAPAGEAAAGVASEPAQTQPTGLQLTVTRLNTALEDAHAILGDKQNQSNLKEGLAAMAKAAAAANDTLASAKQFLESAKGTVANVDKQIDSTGKQIDQLIQKLIIAAEGTSELMASLNQTVTKIETGEGTAGKLLNDPALYNSLLDSASRLEAMLKDLQKLLDEWRVAGVKVKF